MDPLIESLMKRYGLSKEEALVMAEKTRGSDLSTDTRLKVDALRDQVAPYVDRAARIAYFQGLDARHERGEDLSPKEMDYLLRVHKAESARLKGEGASMLAAQRLAHPDAVSGASAIPGSEEDALLRAPGKLNTNRHLDYVARHRPFTLTPTAAPAPAESIWGPQVAPPGPPMPSPEQQALTRSMWRPGATILPNNAGLDIPWGPPEPTGFPASMGAAFGSLMRSR